MIWEPKKDGYYWISRFDHKGVIFSSIVRHDDGWYFFGDEAIGSTWMEMRNAGVFDIEPVTPPSWERKTS